MTKIFVVSNDGVSDGYGRISAETNIRLVKRGYHIMAFGLPFDGLLPPMYDGQLLPYHVAAGANRPDWPNAVAAVIGAYQPDVILVTQDAPYIVTVRSLPLDWSRYGFIALTPVDGAPIFPQWVDVMKQADAALTISSFGVDAYRKQGAHVELCRPGVDGNKFFKLPDVERAALRERAGLPAGAYVVGTACQNQGRKAISTMLTAFFEFAQDKPNARYLLDMDAQSPAGWDIDALCQQFGWERSKLLFRVDLQQRGITDLRERYNLMDCHMVISHREGYGLPLTEAMACGVVSIALDYSSGAEICGGDKGVLIKPIDYTEPGTWGGALDRFPDMRDLVDKLRWLHDTPAERTAIAERGMAWSRGHSWDNSADVVQAAVDRVMAKRAAIPAANVPMTALQPIIA